MGALAACSLDERNVSVGDPAIHLVPGGGASGVRAECSGRLTATCGEIYGAVGDCAATVLSCSADGRWPNAVSCAPTELMASCGAAGAGGREPASNCSGEGLDGCLLEEADGGLGGDGNLLEPTPPCTSRALGMDEIIQTLLEDIRARPASARPFTRYLLLTNRYNAGLCGEELARDRLALAEAVNLLSRNSRIALPTAIDAGGLIYRIDLRDYTLERDVVFANVYYLDVWEAIVATSPYAVPYQGDQADALVLEAVTSVPMLSADALIASTLAGPLYYDALGIEREQPVDDFIASYLGIVDSSSRAPGVMLAGLQESSVQRGSRLVARLPVSARADGYFWQAHNTPEDQGGALLLSDPLRVPTSETLMIFSLENSLTGYAIVNPARRVVDEADGLLDANQNNFRGRVAVSCLRCHATGLLPAEDRVRPFVLANPTMYGADVISDVQASFPASADLAQQMDADNAERFEAMERLSIPRGSRDPVSEAWLRFAGDLRLADAAGDLGVTPEGLLPWLAQLDATLAQLDGSAVDRDDFEASFRSSICLVQSTLENRPTDEYCF